MSYIHNLRQCLFSGLGETLLLLARGAIKEFFNGRAVDHCEAAIGHLTRWVGLELPLCIVVQCVLYHIQ